MKISVFYHVFQAPGWEYIYQSQIHRLYSSGIVKNSNHFFIGVAGKEPLPYIPKKANVKHHLDCSSEAPTLCDLHNQMMQNSEDGIVMYIHTKGVHNKSLQTDAWRLYMEYFLIDKWKICVDVLKLHPCAGVQLNTNPSLHYSGNMWWAQSQHIRSLPSPCGESRSGCEFWVCSSLNKSHRSAWCLHSPPDGMNLYASTIQPKHYVD
jgi:hypothetical protein